LECLWNEEMETSWDKLCRYAATPLWWPLRTADLDLMSLTTEELVNALEPWQPWSSMILEITTCKMLRPHVSHDFLWKGQFSIKVQRESTLATSRFSSSSILRWEVWHWQLLLSLKKIQNT
jgi:hypothetical protein